MLPLVPPCTHILVMADFIKSTYTTGNVLITVLQMHGNMSHLAGAGTEKKNKHQKWSNLQPFTCLWNVFSLLASEYRGEVINGVVRCSPAGITLALHWSSTPVNKRWLLNTGCATLFVCSAISWSAVILKLYLVFIFQMNLTFTPELDFNFFFTSGEVWGIKTLVPAVTKVSWPAMVSSWRPVFKQ